MCLTTKDKKLQIAINDIPCYKILLRDEKGNFHSPYYPMKWEVGKTYINTEVGIEDVFPTHEYKDIYNGYYHTYNSLEGCVINAETDYRASSVHYYVFKAIIPKGSEYYMGKHSAYSYGYASKQLKLTNKYQEIIVKHNSPQPCENDTQISGVKTYKENV